MGVCVSAAGVVVRPGETAAVPVLRVGVWREALGRYVPNAVFHAGNASLPLTPERAPAHAHTRTRTGTYTRGRRYATAAKVRRRVHTPPSGRLQEGRSRGRG